MWLHAQQLVMKIVSPDKKIAYVKGTLLVPTPDK